MKTKTFNKYELNHTNKFFEKMTLKLDNKENILFRHDDIPDSHNFIPLKEVVKRKYILDPDEQIIVEGYLKFILEVKKSRSLKEVI
tara:strand:- start:67 stop:324 length:258 start_codon:yes stop_codon:yes gene_type:complete